MLRRHESRGFVEYINPMLFLVESGEYEVMGCECLVISGVDSDSVATQSSQCKPHEYLSTSAEIPEHEHKETIERHETRKGYARNKLPFKALMTLDSVILGFTSQLD
jgi:hypothetical protein